MGAGSKRSDFDTPQAKKLGVFDIISSIKNFFVEDKGVLRRRARGCVENRFFCFWLKLLIIPSNPVRDLERLRKKSYPQFTWWLDYQVKIDGWVTRVFVIQWGEIMGNITKMTILGLVVVVLAMIAFWAPNITNQDQTEEITDKELLGKIGQMLIVGFQGTEITANSPIAKALQDVNIGGIILFDYDVPSKNFPRNIVNPEQIKKLITNLQKFSPTPLFIAIDAEGGYVNRLKTKYGFIEIPSAEEMGKGSIEDTKKIAIALTDQFVELGLNMNFAPVVDVNVNPDNPVIGGIERSFSNDPKKVAEQALAFIQGQHENNIITAIKHFPGHGSSRDDSHKGMADVTETYLEEELIPYQQLIEKNEVDVIMTAHIMNRKIDPNYPATLSPFFITDILREQLGFDGVVISDDMQMRAITEYFGFAESIILAINAGCDMLIISNNNEIYDEEIPYQAQEIIFEAVKTGKISIDRILEATNRILVLKKQFGLVK